MTLHTDTQTENVLEKVVLISCTVDICSVTTCDIYGDYSNRITQIESFVIRLSLKLHLYIFKLGLTTTSNLSIYTLSTPIHLKINLKSKEKDMVISSKIIMTIRYIFTKK